MHMSIFLGLYRTEHYLVYFLITNISKKKKKERKIRRKKTPKGICTKVLEEGLILELCSASDSKVKGVSDHVVSIKPASVCEP